MSKTKWLVLILTLLTSSCLNPSPTPSYFPDSPFQDYWQTPQETLARGKGDCEDLAILYWYNHQDQWLTYGTADLIGHVWVTSSTGDIVFTTAPNTVHTPKFYFNSKCYRLAGSTSCTGDAKQIKKWNDVLRRMRYVGGD